MLAQAYTTSGMKYDALGRVTEMVLPQDMDGSGNEKIMRPAYNYAGGLQKIRLYDPVTAQTEEYVSEIAYDAKGQRLLIAYGNGIMTRYAYDQRNFRLKRIRSEKFTLTQTGSTLTYAYNSGTVRQDTEYIYDLNGNIVQTIDASPNAGVGGTGNLQRDFTYDPLYRLLSATGREEAKTWGHADPAFHNPTAYTSGSETNTRQYTRTYEYDELGNILKMHHAGGTGGTAISFNRWFNDYNNNPSSAYTSNNLLTKVEYAGTVFNQTFDSNGNMLTEGSSRNFVWDHSDQLKAFYLSASGSISKFAQYLYDAGGNRAKKVVWTSGGDAQVTVYVDGVVDHIYDYDSTAQTRSSEHMELHIMDGRSRIARRRTGTAYTSDSTPVLKYNLEDHLGSSSCTLDSNGSVISKEEYFPFGESSFGSFGKKRYRYVGKEKDEESGLYYYGARHYAPWQFRFVSVDPLALDYPQLTPFNYAGNKPVGDIDVDGLQGTGDAKNNLSKNDNSQIPEGKEYNETYASEAAEFALHKGTKKVLQKMENSEISYLKQKGQKVNNIGQQLQLNYSKRRNAFKDKSWSKRGYRVTTVGDFGNPKSQASIFFKAGSESIKEIVGLSGDLLDVGRMLENKTRISRLAYSPNRLRTFCNSTLYGACTYANTWYFGNWTSDMEQEYRDLAIKEIFNSPDYPSAANALKLSKSSKTENWLFLPITESELSYLNSEGLKFNYQLEQRLMGVDADMNQESIKQFQEIWDIKEELKFYILLDYGKAKRGEDLLPIKGYLIPQLIR